MQSRWEESKSREGGDPMPGGSVPLLDQNTLSLVHRPSSLPYDESANVAVSTIEIQVDNYVGQDDELLAQVAEVGEAAERPPSEPPDTPNREDELASEALAEQDRQLQ